MVLRCQRHKARYIYSCKVRGIHVGYRIHGCWAQNEMFMKGQRHKMRFSFVFQTIRDPRFDERSGTFNEDLFKKSYSFIEDVKEREKQVGIDHTLSFNRRQTLTECFAITQYIVRNCVV